MVLTAPSAFLDSSGVRTLGLEADFVLRAHDGTQPCGNGAFKRGVVQLELGPFVHDFCHMATVRLLAVVNVMLGGRNHPLRLDSTHHRLGKPRCGSSPLTYSHNRPLLGSRARLTPGPSWMLAPLLYHSWPIATPHCKASSLSNPAAGEGRVKSDKIDDRCSWVMGFRGWGGESEIR